MLPVTQSSLVSRMHVTAPTRAHDADLVGYVRSEYGANAAYAYALADRAGRVRSVRLPNGAAGLLRRFLATVVEALAAARSSPGGA